MTFYVEYRILENLLIVITIIEGVSMRLKQLSVFCFLIALIFVFNADVNAYGRKTFGGSQSTAAKKTDKPKSNGKEKPFAERIKDQVEIAG